jgi:tetratricopeptide (TPR) repeat protein
MNRQSTNKLSVHHQCLHGEDLFQVIRGDGKHAEPVRVGPPSDFPVEGQADSRLMAELRWYLERFLDYPFPPETVRAERTQDALRAWGSQAFKSLFATREALRLYDSAVASGHEHLQLTISADDPAVLAWPWEALYDPQVGYLAHTSRIERRLNRVYDPIPLSDRLPRNCVNILLVIARPMDQDIRFRSIARPLVDLIETERLPARVHVLRPPTLDHLLAHLNERKLYYHVLHFDGHGAYGNSEVDNSDRTRYLGPQGWLLFEDQEGQAHPVSAAQLGDLLREYAIPTVVLNACQSAMIDKRADDAFASVAAGLVRSGVRSVVAMAYSVYVSAAQEFLPAFYRGLFKSGDPAEAVREGRRQLRAQPKRVCARGRFPLNDWLVPVLYQQDPLDFGFVSASQDRQTGEAGGLPEEARDVNNPYGFIGRDDAILALERALRRNTPAVVVHGLAGVGKTTLARGFVRWLADTGGLGNGCIWLTFTNVHSADYFINRMGEVLFGPKFAQGTVGQRISALVTALKEARYFVVWDNFESVRGDPDAGAVPALPEEDQRVLLEFLSKLRGSKTKVLITSRSEETWLGECRLKLGLGGLKGEELWEFCDTIVRELGIRIDRESSDFLELIKLLDGHPLLMRAILPLLEEFPAGKIITALRENLAVLSTGESNESGARTYAALQFVERHLSEHLRSLLVPLAFHERFVNTTYFENMAKQVVATGAHEQTAAFARALVRAGLLHHIALDIYALHPALTGFLRGAVLSNTPEQTRDAWARAFSGIMGRLAMQVAYRPQREQQMVHHFHGVNFNNALHEALRLQIVEDITALTQALAIFALGTGDITVASRLFQAFAQHAQAQKNAEAEAAAYSQLAQIAQQRDQYSEAERWCQKSIGISRNLGNKEGLAIGMAQLGNLSAAQRDYASAERYLKEAIPLLEELGVQRELAKTYGSLADVAAEKRDYEIAKGLYAKAAAIFEQIGDLEGVAGIARALAFRAFSVPDLARADELARSLLQTHQNSPEGLREAKVCEELGLSAFVRAEYDAAERWYLKSLAIREKHGDTLGAALTYIQLGNVCSFQDRFEESGGWLLKAADAYSKRNDAGSMKLAMDAFAYTVRWAPPDVQEKLRASWAQTELPPLPVEQDNQ